MKHSNVMTLDHFNDFYYLEAIRTDINQRISQNNELQFKHSLTRLQEDVGLLFDYISTNLAERTRTYIWSACLGEARHAAEGMSKERFIPQIKQKSREDVFSKSRHFPPTDQNIEKVIAVFSSKWTGSFGGKAWKHIAESLLYYRQGATTFIDHVIDLEHNNGTVFSKSESREHLAFACTYNGSLKHFLDYKFRKNILTDSYDSVIGVSREVYLLVMRHNIIFFGKTVTDWIQPQFRVLPEYGFKWGKRTLTVENKWQDWAEVRKSNSPTTSELAEKCKSTVKRQIWKTKEELEEIVIEKCKKAGFSPSGIIKAVKIPALKKENERKQAIYPVDYYLSGTMIKIKGLYGSASYFCKNAQQFKTKSESGYLCVVKSVLYLQTKDMTIELETRQLPPWIQNMESK